YELQIFQSGADPATSEPFIRTEIPASLIVCNQLPWVTPPVAVDPVLVVWSDPDHSDRVCAADLWKFFVQLPPASTPYIATLTVVTSAGMSPRNIFFRTGPHSLTRAGHCWADPRAGDLNEVFIRS